FSPILTHSILSLIATPSTSTYTLSLHDALPIFSMVFTDMATGLQHHRSGALRGLATTRLQRSALVPELPTLDEAGVTGFDMDSRSEEHTSELQSRENLVCRLLLENKKDRQVK